MHLFLEGKSELVLPAIADATFDSCVTDPPYELGFMGKGWDSSGIAYSVDLWREVFRSMKPGAHLLAFGGTRTYHRMACAIEDAGFEIRDQLQWIYGSGFPKSLDVSKAMDKAAGAERFDAIKGGHMGISTYGGDSRNGNEIGNEVYHGINKGAAMRGTPVSESAKQWEGWGTALKPANEPICLARKPLIGTVAQNVLKHGTGAMNIDGCRIANAEGCPAFGGSDFAGDGGWANIQRQSNQLGRYPSNVIHDGSDEVEAIFAMAGERTSGTKLPHHVGRESENRSMSGKNYERTGELFFGSSGSASRFFYVPKASNYDREAGLREAGRRTMNGFADPGVGGSPNARNHHPTVKPTDLMRYLCRLITPPGGLILDPFLGSGSTAKAALMERFRVVGIEMNREYLDIAQNRLNEIQVNLF